MDPRTVVDLEIASAPDRVWNALRDPAEIRRWFGWDYDGLDDEIAQIFVDGATADEAAGTVDTGDGLIAIAPAGEHATRLTVERTAAPEGDPDVIDAGWVTFMQQLRFALERHPGADRTAERLDAPETLPSGEEWFRGPHHTGVVLDGGSELLIVEGDKAVHSRYGG